MILEQPNQFIPARSAVARGSIGVMQMLLRTVHCVIRVLTGRLFMQSALAVAVLSSCSGSQDFNFHAQQV